MSHPKTARRGVAAGVGGMALAVFGTLLHPEIVAFHWIAIAAVDRHGDRHPALARRAHRGAAADRALARLRRSGRRARRHREVLAVARRGELTAFRTGAIALEVILGFLTFTGTLMAAGKLQEVIPTRPITYRGQNFVNLSLLGIALLAGVVPRDRPDAAGCCSRCSSCCRCSSACC